MTQNETRHRGILIDSLQSYAKHLKDVEDRLSPGGKATATALRDTLASAQAKGLALRPEEVTATWREFAAADLGDADLMINQWQPGYGRDNAALVSIGTEHAYELTRKAHDGSVSEVGLGEITIECMAAVIWISGSRPDVLRKIAQGSQWERLPRATAERPYHIYTSDFYEVKSRATWPTIGRDLLRGGHGWRTVLGERCYQIELSGYPALRSVGGRAPETARLEFLKRTLITLSKTASVVIFHGEPKFVDVDPRLRLTAAFLEVDELGSPTLTGKDSGGRIWRAYDHGNRRVIFSRALSGPVVSGEYLSQVSSLIEEAAPEAVVAD